jgi:hypothetical protein
MVYSWQLLPGGITMELTTSLKWLFAIIEAKL